MNDLKQRINNLSPEKRQLLERLLGAESNTGWSRAPYAAPRNEVESKLAEIWSAVLGVSTVGIHDNYFELGGDSIQCIQVISKARRSGIRITTGMLFENPTVEGLAAVAELGAPTQLREEELSGPCPLTPVQRWFFSLDIANRNHWNQAMLLETVPGITDAIIREALQQMLNAHAALRLRFNQTPTGWEQEVAPPGEAISLDVVRVDESSDSDFSDIIREVAERTQRSLDISRGPVVGAAFFDRGLLPGRLLLACHHLVADTVSFRIIAEDLAKSIRLLQDPSTPAPPAERATSWARWCYELAAQANSETIQAERIYWAAQALEPEALPVDYSDGSNLEADAGVYSIALSEEETTALFQKTIAALRADANEILLSATAQVLANWTGQSEMVIDIEGHGRENLDETLDLTRTVGWFTTIYPVRVSHRQADWRATLKSVKEALRGAPRRGFGYGLLRHVIKDQALIKSRPAVAMNYLGRFDRVLPADSPLRVAGEGYGQLYDPAGQRPYVLQVVSLVLDRRLETNWIYSKRLHKQTTIEFVAEDYLRTLRRIITAAGSSERDVVTPADFPDAELTPLELERVLKG
jgi:non-ribosomal peptide synthase protein (TIGR01720 family)